VFPSRGLSDFVSDETARRLGIARRGLTNSSRSGCLLAYSVEAIDVPRVADHVRSRRCRGNGSAPSRQASNVSVIVWRLLRSHVVASSFRGLRDRLTVRVQAACAEALVDIRFALAGSPFLGPGRSIAVDLYEPAVPRPAASRTARGQLSMAAGTSCQSGATMCRCGGRPSTRGIRLGRSAS